MTLPRRSRTRWTVAAIAVLVVAVVSTTAPTEGAWTDRVRVRGTFASTRWATNGSARGAIVSSTLGVTLLATGTAGPVGPLGVSTAGPSSPGPNSATASGLLPTLSVGGLVSANVRGTTGRTEAVFRPVRSAATATVHTLEIGVSALAIPLLENLVALSTSDASAMSAAAECRRDGSSTATASALSQLRVSLLGGTAIPLTVTGATGSATATQLTLANLTRVSVTLGVTRTVSTGGTPTAPVASAQLSAVVSLAVEQRTLLIGPWSTVLGVEISTPISSADCSLVVG